MSEHPDSVQNGTRKQIPKKLITYITAGAAALLLVAAMIIIYFTVVNPGSPGVKQIKAEIVIPGDKIYAFKNSSDQFVDGGGDKNATVYDYLMYLKDNEGLVVNIDGGGFINGFYGHTLDRNKEYFKIYVNGKASNYGVKKLKLKDGDKYSFIPEKTGTGGKYTSSYPDFLKDRDYWLPTQGKKDITVKILFLDNVKTFNLTTQKTYLSEAFEELAAQNKADIRLGADSSFVEMVDGVKYDDYSYFWQVFAGSSENWSEAFEENELLSLTGFPVDWDNVDWENPDWGNLPLDTGKLPGYIFDGAVIFIKLTASSSLAA